MLTFSLSIDTVALRLEERYFKHKKSFIYTLGKKNNWKKSYKIHLRSTYNQTQIQNMSLFHDTIPKTLHPRQKRWNFTLSILMKHCFLFQVANNIHLNYIPPGRDDMDIR